MKFSFSVILASCVAMVMAESVVELLQSVPVCAQKCLLPMVVQMQCNISTPATLAACLCPDVFAQRNISSCTQTHCNYTQQVTVVEISTQLCTGYPVPSRSHEMVNTAIVLICVMTPFVILRLFSRFLMVRNLWWDDWMIIVATALSITIFGIEIYIARQGFGKHIWNIYPGNVSSIQLLFYIAQLFYIVVQVMTKISILILYLRIFPQRPIRYTVIISMTLMALHGIAFVFVVAFQCMPVYSIWNGAVSAKCLDKNAIVLIGAASSILEDFLVLLLPIPCVKSLKIKTGKRISLFIMFSIGAFACITSMIRLKYVVGFGDYTDASWDNVDAFNWSCIEIATAIVCACLPALRVLLSRMAPNLFGSLQSHNTPPSGSAMIRSFDRKGLSRIEDSETTPSDSIMDGAKGGARVSVSVARSGTGSKAERSWAGSSEDTELVPMKT